VTVVYIGLRLTADGVLILSQAQHLFVLSVWYTVGIHLTAFKPILYVQDSHHRLLWDSREKKNNKNQHSFWRYYLPSSGDSDKSDTHNVYISSLIITGTSGW